MSLPSFNVTPFSSAIHHIYCTFHSLRCKQFITGAHMDTRPGQIFMKNWDKLHGEVWAKSCLEPIFQPIRMSFDHPSEAPKLAILA